MKAPWEGAARRATKADFVAEAERIGCDLATVQAVWEVEAAGEPFRADRSLQRRLEPHKLRRPQGTWRTSLKMTTAAREHAFAVAYADDPEDACRATSWGAPQIMGLNCKLVGYPTAISMVSAFADDEAAQVRAFGDFILATPALASAMRARDWQTVARLYNGNANVPVYAAKMESAYRRITGGAASPVVLRSGDKGAAVRRLQEALGVPVDGSFGPTTLAAVRRFQQANGLKVDGKVGAKTWEALELRRDAAPLMQQGTADRWIATGTKVAGAVGAMTAAMAGVGDVFRPIVEAMPESTLNIAVAGGVGLAAIALIVFAIQRRRGIA